MPPVSDSCSLATAVHRVEFRVLQHMPVAVRTPSIARLIAVPALISIAGDRIATDRGTPPLAKATSQQRRLWESDPWGYLVGADLWDLFCGQAPSYGRRATTFRPAAGSCGFSVGPEACWNVRDGIPRDDICCAAVDELHCYPRRRCPGLYRVADALQGTVGLRIPVSNSSGHRPVPSNAWPLGHALRRLGSRIPSHRFLANFSARFLRPNIFFMEAYTVIVGALVGIATAAVLGRIRRALQEIRA
jgi:hypothetical protein